MADLLERYNELKRAKSESVDVADLKKRIESLNQLDSESITAAVGSGMLRFFSDQFDQADKRKEDTIKEITDQLGKVIVNAAKINKQNISDTSKALTESVNGATKAINEAINNIPQADLSGLDASIKGIKATDVTSLEMEIANLTRELIKLSSKKPVKQKEINLDPIIEMLNKPVNVEFDIEYDQWDYPIKITATEVK